MSLLLLLLLLVLLLPPTHAIAGSAIPVRVRVGRGGLSVTAVRRGRGPVPLEAPVSGFDLEDIVP